MEALLECFPSGGIIPRTVQSSN